MQIRLKLFAAFREAVGQRDVTQTVADGTTVAGLIAQVLDVYPALVPLMQTSMVMVNQEYSPPETALRDGDVVAFIPPLGGGQ